MSPGKRLRARNLAKKSGFKKVQSASVRGPGVSPLTTAKPYGWFYKPVSREMVRFKGSGDVAVLPQATHNG